LYKRSSYNVTYAYENAPNNAPTLPTAKPYKYMEDVTVATPVNVI